MQLTEKKEQVILVRRSSGVVLVIFDNPGKFNYLGTSTVDDLEAAVETLRRDDSIKGAIIISGKPDSFIIGADIVEIRKCESIEALQKLSRRGQEVMNKLADLPKPVVAAINGPCLGGGLELAISCDYRIATPGKETILGLPETRLGIIPGLGGTQRLPRLVGLKQALEIILSAEPLTASQALEAGLVDKLVSSDLLIEAAEELLLENLAQSQSAGTGVKATRHCKSDLNPEKARKLIAISERAVRIKTKGHYPAQTKVLPVILFGLENGIEKGMQMEVEVFAELAATPASAHLMSLFFAMDYATQSAKLLAKKFPGTTVSKLALVGAGQMGTTMACLAASSGIDTQLKTRSSRVEEVERLCSNPAVSCDSAVKTAKLRVTDSDAALAEADLIIECLIEDLETKQALLKHCADVAGEDCVIASNTSSLTIAEITAGVKNPERCLGLHFFHPVDRMPLVEIVVKPETSKQALARAASFILSIGKTPLVVKDGPGFLINRLFTVYLLEVAEMGEKKVPANWIEEAAIDFGMPVGPYQVMDEIGLDISFTVADHLDKSLGGCLTSPPVVAKALAMGRRGRKANDGFFVWEGEQKGRHNRETFEHLSFPLVEEKCPPDQLQKIADQLIIPMIDEAARCLEEKVVSRPREVDVGMVLAVGFPAFRGGLLRYADSIGLKEVYRKLEAIYSASPRPRRISDTVRRYAEQGRGFYSLSGKED